MGMIALALKVLGAAAAIYFVGGYLLMLALGAIAGVVLVFVMLSGESAILGD